MPACMITRAGPPALPEASPSAFQRSPRFDHALRERAHLEVGEESGVGQALTGCPGNEMIYA